MTQIIDYRVPNDSKLSFDIVSECINKNLENHYKCKPESRIGTGAAFDLHSNPYKTYVQFITYGVVVDGIFSIMYVVDNIINGLIQSKQYEKPEGMSIGKRDCIVEWRQFPTISLDHDDFNCSPKYKLAFRVSVYHKEVI